MPLTLITAGESHGPGLTCLVEGLPAGLELDREAIDRDMARRQLGHGRGGRMKIESDRAQVTAGVRHGRTLGGPIALQVANRDYANWEDRMNPWPVEAEVAEVHLPRPGHADLVGTQKYGLTDVRDVLERASARETAARVAGGALAKAFLRALGVEVVSHVVQIGTVRAGVRAAPLTLDDFAGVDHDPVRCLDPEASRAMVGHINVQRKANESIGGSFEVLAFGLVPGLGSHVSWEERLDGRLAMAIVSIQAIKGVEFGDGFAVAARRGSQAHDEIEVGNPGVRRVTARAGGVEGGMTTGEPLRVRAAMKPISTLSRPLGTVDVRTGEPAKAIAQRSDVCAVPAAGVIAEAVVAIALADAALEKFGGDSVEETRRNCEAYVKHLAVR